MTICATRIPHMPNGHAPDPQQTTFWAAIGVAVGGLCGTVGTWLTGYLGRRTVLETKKIDHEEILTAGMRADIASLNERLTSAVSTADVMRVHLIELQEKVSHQNIEMERMRAQIEKLTSDKTQMQEDHVAELARKDKELADVRAENARLKQQIADLDIVGVGEVAPPKRFKGDGI